MSLLSKAQSLKAYPGRPASSRKSCIAKMQALAQLGFMQTLTFLGDRTQEVRIPTTYRQLVATTVGNSFRDVAHVVEKTMPTPADDEVPVDAVHKPSDKSGEPRVLVKVTFAGVNGGCETFRARGDHAFKPNHLQAEIPLGSEGTGLVVATGENVENLKVGDHIACRSMSSFSEYSTPKAGKCRKIPSGSPEIVALILSGVIACAAIDAVCKVQKGETILVTAAAGGTGHFAAQCAQLAGARVIGTCGGNEKAKALQALGLHRVIDYTCEDVASVLKNEYPNGVDVAYEGVGGKMLQAALLNLHPQGRLLSIGYISQYPHAKSQEASAPIADGLPSPENLFWKGMTVKRGGQVLMGSTMPKDPKLIPACEEKIFEWFEKGKIRAWTDSSKHFKGIDSIPDAIDHMLTGKHIGKVVVEM